MPAGDRDLNVLVITLDTIRADGLGAYGNSRVQTDFVDGLAIMDADENVDFDVRHLNLGDKGEPAHSFFFFDLPADGRCPFRTTTREPSAGISWS